MRFAKQQSILPNQVDRCGKQSLKSEILKLNYRPNMIKKKKKKKKKFNYIKDWYIENHKVK